MQLRQALKRNIEARIGMEDGKIFRSANALADAAKVSQTHLSKALRLEASVTTDFLAQIARPLHCQPWELLVDQEETRREALARMLKP